MPVLTADYTLPDMIHVLAFHGWAHDAGAWAKIDDLLVPEIKLSAQDRGYFFDNQQKLTYPRKADKVILMAQGDGLLHIPVHWFSKADGLILIGCFENYGKGSAISRMHQTLTFNTALVLGQYHANCSYPRQSNWSMPRIFSLTRLRDDLDKLNNKTFKTDLVNGKLPVLMLHGDSDKIVPVKQGEELAGKLNTKVEKIPKSGHGCIYTHHTECVTQIERFIGQLSKSSKT